MSYYWPAIYMYVSVPNELMSASHCLDFRDTLAICPNLILSKKSTFKDKRINYNYTKKYMITQGVSKQSTYQFQLEKTNLELFQIFLQIYIILVKQCCNF